MDETFYKPMTPDLRAAVNKSISDSMAKLDACESNAFTAAYAMAYKTASMMINALPDGYPVPMTRKK